MPENQPTVKSSIDRALRHLETLDPASTEYAQTITQIDSLKKIQNNRSFSTDTVMICATNLLGILIVTKYEQFNVITTKAFGSILRPH